MRWELLAILALLCLYATALIFADPKPSTVVWVIIAGQAVFWAGWLSRHMAKS